MWAVSSSGWHGASLSFPTDYPHQALYPERFSRTVSSSRPFHLRSTAHFKLVSVVRHSYRVPRFACALSRNAREAGHTCGANASIQRPR